MAKINYELLDDRVCVYCKSDYTPTGPAQRACRTCIRRLLNLNQQVSRDIARFKKFGTYEAVGKGGANKIGKGHGQYTKGEGFFANILRPAVKTRRFCERCGKDLKDAGQYEWCVHHRDHIRSNNVIGNMELLCKRCHQLEHDCSSNLPQ